MRGFMGFLVTRTPPANRVVQVDHVEQTFVVRIRSLSGVSTERLKGLIQNENEVTFIEKTGTATVYRR